MAFRVCGRVPPLLCPQFYRNAARVTNSVSLDAGVKNPTDGGSRDSTELGVTLGDGPSPEDLSQETDMRDKISALLDTLDYREERVSQHTGPSSSMFL